MPLLTPTRSLVVLASFLLISFLWTWGLPHRYITPSLPLVDNDKLQGKPVAGQLVPEPLVEFAGQGGAKQEAATPPTTLATAIRPGTTRSADVGSDKGCKDVRGAKDVMIVVRTSRAEVEGKLPDQLMKLLSCAPNVLIFSDHQGKIDNYPVHDALDAVTKETKSKYREFMEYDKMQTDKDYKLTMDKANALDKWKYLPMVYKTAIMAPNHKFYMFIEPDTSLSWTNLLQWFDRLDYRIPYYSGVPKTVDDKRYAQRGPGIMLSYGALQQFWPRYEERYATDWESVVALECCGDLALGNIMKQSRVEYYSAIGLLETETPSTVEWTKRFWCTPVVSWHHLPTTTTDALREALKAWTQKHGWAEPYTHFNAFEHFVRPQLAEQIEDWDNVSSDTQLKPAEGSREKAEKQEAGGDAAKDSKGDTKSAPPSKSPASGKLRKRDEDFDALIQSAASSPQGCKAFCQRTDDCLQWKYTSAGDGECHLGKALRLGAKVEKPDKNARWTSGWMLERVNKVTDEWGKCEKAEWKFNQ